MTFKEWLVSETEDNRILFYNRDREQYGFLSNFHPSPFVLDGQQWPDVEHYYVAMKSTDPQYQQQVLSLPTPGKAKRFGSPEKMVKAGFALRPDWEQVKLQLMFRAVMAKFAQNAQLAQALKATGNAELIEDSLTDLFWGSGADGSGKNWLGQMLMQVRSKL